MLVCDDGICEVYGFCFLNDNGIVIKVENGFFVIKCMGEN